jgi:hypothetical protein
VFQDTSSLGRLIGIPYFLTEASFTDEKNDMNRFRRARNLDDDGIALRLAQVEAVRRVRQYFDGHMIRRTTESTDWEAKKLIDLPPHKEIIGVLALTERETNIIQDRAEAARAR